MLNSWFIILVSFAYLGVLFAIAYYGDKRADEGRSIISRPTVYALSLAVYCTSWTFYGSVGRAASSGAGFLTIYLGPTLMAALWWLVLRKIIRISKVNRITSIADFVASRYGKSHLLGGMVTVIAVVGIIPYISLQLKAVSNSFSILWHYPEIVMPARIADVPVSLDTAFYVALLLAAFTIVFGTRHLDASERHEGMVAAIAFESLVKLLAFLAVGLFVTFGMFKGFGDLFSKASDVPKIQSLLSPFGGAAGSYGSWAWLTFLSMMAIVFLPRQFQVAVVENVDEEHLNKAIWLFPLYLFAINIFVLPITFAGLMRFPEGNIDADTFVLALPMAEHQGLLALFVFIGGLSAATGMVIVETIALSTMVCNDLVMPILLRLGLGLEEGEDITGWLLTIRRVAIISILLLGYAYFRQAGEAYALVSIGLVSFAAVAQFAPALLGGIFWKGGTRIGAFAGLSAGFIVWIYTLLLPSFARSGWLPESFLRDGPFGLSFLKPTELFGLTNLDQMTHAMMWSMLANVGSYIFFSLISRQSAVEHSQAILFVDVFKRTGEGSLFWRGTASVTALHDLLGRFLGQARADEIFSDYAKERGVKRWQDLEADPELIHHAEILLAGAIGSASARVMVSTVAKEEPLGIEEVMDILDETSQAIAYSHQLEEKSKELEEATAELKAANERLQELDRLKDDFISTVTHELRTPLTSIRAFSEILRDNPKLKTDERENFLSIIIKESERLTRLINQVLDLAKLEAGKAEWHPAEISLKEIIEESLTTTSQLFKEKEIQLEVNLPESSPTVMADRDRLMQVMLNLLSNAAKFCDQEVGIVTVRLRVENGNLRIDVKDNGPGISPEHQQSIFDKFHQVGDMLLAKPEGTGLGLPISRQIITHFGGSLWVESEIGKGAVFAFTLPVMEQTDNSI